MFDNYFFNWLKNKSVSCKILTLRQIFNLYLIQIPELNFSIGIFKSYFKYKNFKPFNIKFYYPSYWEISQKLISMESLYFYPLGVSSTIFNYSRKILTQKWLNISNMVKKTTMAAKRSVRQRRQYLTPETWEYNIFFDKEVGHIFFNFVWKHQQL